LKSGRPAVEVARGASYLIANNIVNMIVSILAFAVIARLISREEMGGLAVLSLLASGAQVLAGLGIDSTAVHFVASFEGTGEYEKMRRAGYGCLILNGIGVLLLVAAIYLSADALASSLLGSISAATLIKLLTLEIAAIGINLSLTGILVGLKRFREISLTSMVSFIIRQGLVILFLELGWGLPGLVVAWGIGASLNSFTLAAYVRKLLGPPQLGFDLFGLLRFSSPLLFGGLANYAWRWFDRALLLPFVSLAQLGSYNVAVTAYGLLSSMPSAVSGTLFPFYSKFYSERGGFAQATTLEKAVKTASRYVSFFTVPLGVGLAVTALPAATLLAGVNYADAALPLAILSISLAATCLVTGLGQIFVVLGRTVTSGTVTIASVLVTILMGTTLVNLLGVSGAAIARALSLITTFVLSVLILRGIMVLRFDMRAYSKAWAASLLMAGVVLGFQMGFYSRYLLLVYVALGGLVYILVLRWLHAIEPEDVDLASEFLGPKLGVLANWAEKILGVRKNARGANR